jgi:hypothetical protein
MRNGADPMKSLLAMMRLFHYMVGITAPSKEKERMVFFVWIGVFTGLALLAILCVLVIVPYILR